jgi:hypothetical protein
MATFIRRHSFAVAACAAVIGGFGYFCAKYVPLYRAYHVNHDISDETVSDRGKPTEELVRHRDGNEMSTVGKC